MTTAEVAERWGVTAQAVHKRRKSGSLKAFRVSKGWRYRLPDVEACECAHMDAPESAGDAGSVFALDGTLRPSQTASQSASIHSQVKAYREWLEARRRAGELVEREDARAALRSAAEGSAAAFRAMPQRLAAAIIAELAVDPNRLGDIRAMIDAEVQEALARLAECEFWS